VGSERWTEICAVKAMKGDKDTCAGGIVVVCTGRSIDLLTDMNE